MVKNEPYSDKCCQGTLHFKCMPYLYFILNIYQLTDICYRSHTDSLSKYVLISNNPNGEKHKNCPKTKRNSNFRNFLEGLF